MMWIIRQIATAGMSKTINFIRHAQSTFNEVFDQTGIDPLHFDSRVSAAGHQQIAVAGEVLANFEAELVVTSPLTRAIETALGLFAGRAPVLVEALHRERLANS
jgi:glucosyl-3-phosphoglycerate phosphatase